MVTALWMLPQPEGPEILVAHHVKRTAGTPELEVASADPATVAAHFRDKVPFEPQVPTIEGASLLGGRLCSIDDERVQLLFYARGDAVTSVFVSGQKRWDAGCEDVDGHRVCYAPGASTTAIGIGPDAERLGNTHR